MTFYNREKPLLERKHVPCELFVCEKDATSGCTGLFRNQKSLFTLRVLQGHRPVSQDDKNTERSIRLELSDEYNHISNKIKVERRDCLNDEFGPSMAIENMNSAQHRHGPIHFPVLRQNTQKVPLHFATFQSRTNEIDGVGNSIGGNSEHRSIDTYELEVGESDFAQLRKDQALLVDFSDFSKSLIDLLMQCDLGSHDQIDGTFNETSSNLSTEPQVSSDTESFPNMNRPMCRNELKPKFTCRIEDYSRQDKKKWKGNSFKNENSIARFSIVESNQFRELVHLSLDIEKGTDATVRSYLSARLYELIGQNAMLKFNLKSEMERASLGAKAWNKMSQKYNEFVSIAEKERNALAQEAGQTIQNENSKRCSELQVIRSSYEENTSNLRNEMEEQMKISKSKIDKVEAEIRRISVINAEKDTAMMNLELRFKDCETKHETSKMKVESLHEEMRSIVEERDNLKKALQQSESFASELEASNDQYESRFIESYKELSVSKEIAQQTRLDADKYSAQANALQQELSAAKEDRDKSKELLCRYQQDRQEMKRRMKAKVELIQKQEEILASKEIHSTDTQDKLVETDRECHQLRRELEQVKNRFAEAEKELDGNKKTLSNNQQVIAWLNKEATIKHTSGGLDRAFGRSISSNIGVHSSSSKNINGNYVSNTKHAAPEYQSPPFTRRPMISNEQLPVRCMSRTSSIPHVVPGSTETYHPQQMQSLYVPQPAPTPTPNAKVLPTPSVQRVTSRVL